MFFLVPTIATFKLLLCGGGLWEGERGLTFHSKVVSVFIMDCNTEQTSLSINLEKNRKSSVLFNNGFKSYFSVFGVW